MDERPDDFQSIITDAIVKVDWFLYLIILVAFLIVISDIFTARILPGIRGTMKGSEITAWGHIVQGLGMITIIVMGQITKKYF
jgi:capsule polysaccharide export protein KpsE/RkpR